MSPAVTVGVSLKMYFGHRDALDWFARVAQTSAAHPDVVSGAVELFIVPTYLQILPALRAFSDTPVRVGAQDAAVEDAGAFTGEVSAAELAEVGVELVEIGHAERRRLYGESEPVVAAKTRAALRNGLAPVLCIGEVDRMDEEQAAATVIAQLHSALEGATGGRIVVAYEPVWAIGASDPAPARHIRHVCAALRSVLTTLPGRAGSSVIYGGSARPGLLATLDDSVDGLFLGRFAHDPDDLHAVIDEAAALSHSRSTARA